MVSGIGPEETLKRLGITVLSPLAGVGKNLIVPLYPDPARNDEILTFSKDQPFFGPTYRVNVTGTQSQLIVNSTFLLQAIESYLRNQSGPLTTSVSNYLGKRGLFYARECRLTSMYVA